MFTLGASVPAAWFRPALWFIFTTRGCILPPPEGLAPVFSAATGAEPSLELNRLMSYWLLAVAALMFGLYNVFIKMSADHIDPILGAVVLQFIAAFAGLGLLLYTQLSGGGGSLHFSTRGLALAALAGLAIGLVEILTFFIYGRGIPVAVGNPLIIGGSLLVTTGTGVLLLRESVSPMQVGAAALIAIGIGALAWDAVR